MTDREMLIELIADFFGSAFPSFVFKAAADHLIANGVTVQKWIPVTERLPDAGEDVMVFGYWHERFQPLIAHHSPHYKGRWYTSIAGQEIYAVTHWMPLPEPPKEGE